MPVRFQLTGHFTVLTTVESIVPSERALTECDSVLEKLDDSFSSQIRCTTNSMWRCTSATNLTDVTSVQEMVKVNQQRSSVKAFKRAES